MLHSNYILVVFVAP